MKLVTWNMNHWQKRAQPEASWDFLISKLRPDIALLQEAVPPQRVLEQRRVAYQEIGETRRWGSAVYAREDLEIWPISFRTSHAGAATVAEVARFVSRYDARIVERVRLAA